MLTGRRKAEIKTSAVGVLQAADVHSLPVDLNVIIDYNDWYCLTYTAAKAEGIATPPYEDGHTVTEIVNGETIYMILYKDTAMPQRIRWTIAHEIGHIALGHFGSDVPHAQANDEAQYFAEQLLSPIAVIAKMGATSIEDIARLCNLSHEAAEWRYEDLQRHHWYYKKYGYTAQDKAFLQQFDLFE